MQNVSRSGEKGRTASLWLVGESRILYVRAWESRLMLLIAFLQKLSASFFIPQTCLFRTDFEPMAHHVKESNHCIIDTEN